LGDFANKSLYITNGTGRVFATYLEGQLADKKLGTLLIAADLSVGDQNATGEHST